MSTVVHEKVLQEEQNCINILQLNHEFILPFFLFLLSYIFGKQSISTIAAEICTQLTGAILCGVFCNRKMNKKIGRTVATTSLIMNKKEETTFFSWSWLGNEDDMGKRGLRFNFCIVTSNDRQKENSWIYLVFLLVQFFGEPAHSSLPTFGLVHFLVVCLCSLRQKCRLWVAQQLQPILRAELFTQTDCENEQPAFFRRWTKKHCQNKIACKTPKKLDAHYGTFLDCSQI